MSILRAVAESEGTPPRALALADALDIPAQPGASASLRELLRVGSVPRYRPARRWNSDQTVMAFHNCYNYATDVMDYSYAQPGMAHGARPTSHLCASYTVAAVADGLISTGGEQSLAGVEFGHVVALVMAPHDYHWYRRGRDGMWSHKVGTCPASNLDNSFQPITDPWMVNRGDYTEFCGFFSVPRAGIDITGPHAGIVDRPGADPAPASGATIVRMRVFSGRPDPEWVIDADEAAALAAKLAAARRGTRLTTVVVPPACPLGPRGYEIDQPGAVPGTRDISFVHAGLLSDVRLTGAERRTDTAGLEEELAEQARRRGFGNLL